MRGLCLRQVSLRNDAQGDTTGTGTLKNVSKQPLLGVTMALQYAFKYAECFHELRK